MFKRSAALPETCKSCAVHHSKVYFNIYQSYITVMQCKCTLKYMTCTALNSNVPLTDTCIDDYSTTKARSVPPHIECAVDTLFTVKMDLKYMVCI